MTRRSALLGALVVLAMTALAGCAATPGVVSSTRPTTVDAPLTLASQPATDEALIGWPGAAGQIVRCSGPVVGTTRGAPYGGEDVGTTPDAALEAGRSWFSWDGAQNGFSFVKEADDRRLYVLDVDGLVKQALILRHGPALRGDGTRDTVTRWWLESWARCDYAELPDEVARERGLQLWTDADGRRQPTSTLVSFDFRGDCFPGTTALDVDGPVVGGSGEDAPVEYVRAPHPDLRSYFADSYVEHTAVPGDAIDSGYSRAGDRLWFAEDRRFAYIGSEDDAEAWPRSSQPIRCA